MKQSIFSCVFALFLTTPALANTGSGIDVSVLKSPAAAKIDGQNHFFYELVIHNRSASEIFVEAIDIDGAPEGKIHLNAEQIQSRFKLLGTVDLDQVSDWLALAPPPALVPRHIPVDRSALIYLDIAGPIEMRLPKMLKHLLTLSRTERTTSSFQIKYNVTLASGSPLVLASPFGSGFWFPFNGPTNDSAHRRSVQRIGGHYYIAQRFAIDWGGVGDNGYLLRENSSSKQNSSYYGYGYPVYAVADATVYQITDDLPENMPGTDKHAVTINLQTVAGNSVVLDLGSSRYALYAHLQPGSLRVKKGQRIREGELIGLLGNSGNSSGPHLHFHVCDGPSILECQGVPYVFKTFVHTPVKGEGDDLEHARFTPIDAEKVSNGELIWNNQVIDFGKLK
jgi:murein DD-endopeptidase MepM/ murein hydrolase activator NlpD